MYVCMYECIICTNTNSVYVCVYVCMYLCVSVYVIYEYIYMYVCMYVCMYIWFQIVYQYSFPVAAVIPTYARPSSNFKVFPKFMGVVITCPIHSK